MLRGVCLVAAAAAKTGERGSLAKVIKACGLSGVTVWRGYSDLSAGTPGERSDGSIRTRRTGGGSNGSRNRLWKVELQKLSNELGMEICVCHFPPGTRKTYKTGIRVADEALRGLNMCSQVDEGPEQIRRWNYLFRPQRATCARQGVP